MATKSTTKKKSAAKKTAAKKTAQKSAASSSPKASTKAPTATELAAQWDDFRNSFGVLKTEIQKAIVGYDDLLTDTLVAIFARGHVLLEGVPGLGKTFLVKTISEVLGLEAGRIQCTPDLMPADILGTQIVNEDGNGRRTLHFEKGPVFANIVLVDEINRATPKTQAALLEVMQECRVTAGGETHVLPQPFFVLATQNPMEMEGTYPLPEAQLDRFLFKVHVPFPDLEALVEISRRTTGSTGANLKQVLDRGRIMAMQQALEHVPIADPYVSYAAEIVLATHPDSDTSVDQVKRYVAYGSSPRGLQALVRGAKAYALLEGRTAATDADIRRAAKVALRHRTILNFEGEAESLDVEGLLDSIINGVKAPGSAA